MSFKFALDRTVSVSVDEPRENIPETKINCHGYDSFKNIFFPIAIGISLLILIEAKLQILSDSINKLSKNINIVSIK